MHDIFPRELRSDYMVRQRKLDRQNRNARLFLFGLALILFAYMWVFAHNTDTSLKAMNVQPSPGYADSTPGEYYPNPI